MIESENHVDFRGIGERKEKVRGRMKSKEREEDINWVDISMDGRMERDR